VGDSDTFLADEWRDLTAGDIIGDKKWVVGDDPEAVN
jgi:hypothetical protein